MRMTYYKIQAMLISFLVFFFFHWFEATWQQKAFEREFFGLDITSVRVAALPSIPSFYFILSILSFLLAITFFYAI